MNSGLSDLFIRRPVMTVLVMVSILLFGLIGYRQLAISDLPNVDFPTILVSANLPGASADTMASTVICEDALRVKQARSRTLRRFGIGQRHI